MTNQPYKKPPVLLMFVSLLLFFYSFAYGADEDFTIIVLPDTQIYAQNQPQIFRAQAEWIAANAESLNIKMVLHVGDVVNKGANDMTQWSNAKQALDIIDQAGVPLFIAMGNHDYDDLAKTRSATVFNRYFGMARYLNKPWFGGAFTEGKAENVYGLISAGGRNYLVFALEFAPRQAVVDWANDICAQYPDHDVIITTHNYLYSDGTHHNRLNQTGTYGVSVDSHTGRELWEELVGINANVTLVVSGHVGGDGISRRSDFTKHGNLVHQLEANYQFRPQGGAGYLRVMQVRPAAGVIEVTTYSPYLDAYYRDGDNQFTLPYNPSMKRWPVVTLQGYAPPDHITNTPALVTLEHDGTELNADYADAGRRFVFQVLPGIYTVKQSAYNRPTSYVTVEADEPGKTYELQFSIADTIEPFSTVVTADTKVWAGYGGKLSGKLAEGGSRDIVMWNNKLSMIIAEEFNDPQLSGVTLGKPIDMAVRGVDDGIDWMNMPYLSLERPIWDGSGAIATVKNTRVQVVYVTAEEVVVETDGVYSEAPGVTIRTRYSIRPDEEWVHALTTISNSRAEDLTVWLGDVMDNDDGRQYAYVPGIGDLGPGVGARRAYEPSEPWVGHYGNAPQGYAFVYDANFGEFVNFGSNITVMTQKQVTIPAHGQYDFGRYIVAVSTEGYKHKMDAVKAVYEKILTLD
jgi:hypothetical protein